MDQISSNASSIDSVADHILRGAGKAPHLVLGPVVWEPAPTGRRWYFMVAAGRRPGGFRTDRIAAETQALAEQIRASLLMALPGRGPMVVHDMDDELQMARLCAAIWPCRKAKQIAAGIEAERAAS